MKKMLLPVCFVVFIISSCTNADPKKMAADVCECMDPAIGKLSSKSKKIIIKAFKNDEPQTVLQEELQAIDDEEERTKVQTEITKAGTLMQGKKMQNCLEEIDKKYKVLKSDVEEKQQEVVTELKAQCEPGAYIFKYGLEHKAGGKKMKDDTEENTEEEETPKKKKKTTDEEE